MPSSRAPSTACTPTACSNRRSGCARPSLPRTIGVVCGEQSKARDDVLAGLRRRGWQGRLVWAFAPVQDRRAAPAIAAALRELAAIDEVEVVIVARGGGSLADLFAFCDEALCRTVALLRVPVISSVGHHTDRTLIDDVAAVCCSTPTHAAEAAVPVDVGGRAARLAADARRLRDHGRRALLTRARTLGDAVPRAVPAPRPPAPTPAPAHCASCGPARGAGCSAAEPARAGARPRARARRRRAAPGSDAGARRRELERLTLALGAHDPAADARPRLRARHRPRPALALGSAQAARAAGYADAALRRRRG